MGEFAAARGNFLHFSRSGKRVFLIVSLYFQNYYAGGNIIASHNRFENDSIFYLLLFNSVAK